MSDLDLVHATARELFGRAVWTHKVHEVEREQSRRRLDRSMSGTLPPPP